MIVINRLGSEDHFLCICFFTLEKNKPNSMSLSYNHKPYPLSYTSSVQGSILQLRMKLELCLFGSNGSN